MTDQLRVVRDHAVEIEGLLTAMGGQGNGLGEKGRSLSGVLSETLQRNLKQVSGLRNRVMHDGVDLSESDFRRFTTTAETVINDLKRLNNQVSEDRATSVYCNLESEQRLSNQVSEDSSAGVYFNLESERGIQRMRNISNYHRMDGGLDTPITIILIIAIGIPLGIQFGGTGGFALAILGGPILGVLLHYMAPKFVGAVGSAVIGLIKWIFYAILASIAIAILGGIGYIVVTTWGK